jgi:hypothetical protein
MVTAVLYVGSSLLLAANETAKADTDIDFSGKVVLLIVDYSNAVENKRGTEYLNEPVIKKIGDRYFIAGKAFSLKESPAGTDDDWRKGSDVGIAWEKVQQYYVFSPDKMVEIIKKRLEQDDE